MPRSTAMGDDVSCYVAVAPGARGPTSSRDWLRRPRARAGLGLDVVPPRRRAARGRRTTSLRLVPVGAARGRRLRPGRRDRLRAPGRGGPVGRHGRTRSGGTAGSRSTATSRRRAAGVFVAERRRLPRLRRHAARAPRQGRPERPARGAASTTRASAAATSSSPRPASAATTFPRARTATSSAPGSARSPCARTGCARRRHGLGEPGDEPAAPEEARAHQPEPREDEDDERDPDAAHAPAGPPRHGEHGGAGERTRAAIESAR